LLISAALFSRFDGVLGLGLVTQTSWIRVPPGPLSSNNLEQVIYTHHVAQANSAFHPSEVGNE